MALDVLIVDDEADIRELVAGILTDEGYEARVAHDAESALSEIEARLPSLLVLDIWLKGGKHDGLQILEIVKSRHKDLPVIMISGHGNIETAVAAIKMGAYDFIEKPFQAGKLLHLVGRATEAERLRRENEDLRHRMGFIDSLTGNSPAVSSLRQNVNRVAPTNSRVLITGEPGAGKEVVARLIHKQSKRSNANFIAVTSATIEPERMESELFGVEQNGRVVKIGLFEQAHGGTLFLDEIADMPLPTQAKILRVLTDQRFTRLGGTNKVVVDVRVISATSRDLKVAMAAREFREDLFHRLNVVPVHVPPIRDRREDIPKLVEEFVTVVSRTSGRPARRLDEAALAALQAYEWPGNVRQLRNVIERTLILARGDASKPLSVESLPPEIGQNAATLMPSGEQATIMAIPLRQAREEFEREYLKVQILRFSGNISRTANFVGMERSALHRKLKSLGLSGRTSAKTVGE